MPTLLPTIREEDNLPWTRLMWHYRMQFQAMAAAAVIFVAGGMKLAWSLFEMPSGKCHGNDCTHQLTVMWLIGGVFGVICAATFVQRVTKNVAYTTSGFLLIIGGILFLIFPNNFPALMGSCLCEGGACGLTQVQALASAGEISHKDIRGLIVSVERIFLWLGICLQLCLSHLWFSLEPASGYFMYMDQFHGIIVACLGLAALVLTVTQRIESPVVLIQQQQRELIITHVVKRLLGTPYPTTEVVQMREDCRLLVAYDSNEASRLKICQRNIVPLVKVLLLRCFATMSLSLPFNRAYLAVSWNAFGCELNCIYVLAVCGLVGCIAGALLIDEYGRRKLAVLSLLLASICIFIVGGIFRHLQLSKDARCIVDLRAVATLMLIYQIVICAGVQIASTVYIAEAFSVRCKAQCIAFVLFMEQAVQILLAVWSYHSAYNFSILFFSMGSVSLCMGLFVFLFMPETNFLSLYQCLRKFN